MIRRNLGTSVADATSNLLRCLGFRGQSNSLFSSIEGGLFYGQGRRNGKPKGRHVYSEEFRQEAVQMLLDGHSAASVASGWDFPVRPSSMVGKRNPSSAPAPRRGRWAIAFAISKRNSVVSNESVTS